MRHRRQDAISTGARRWPPPQPSTSPHTTWLFTAEWKTQPVAWLLLTSPAGQADGQHCLDHHTSSMFTDIGAQFFINSCFFCKKLEKFRLLIICTGDKIPLLLAEHSHTYKGTTQRGPSLGCHSDLWGHPTYPLCLRSRDSSRARSRWAGMKEYLVQRWRQPGFWNGTQWRSTMACVSTAPEPELAGHFPLNLLLPCSQIVTKGQALHQSPAHDTTHFSFPLLFFCFVAKGQTRPSLLEGGFAHHHTTNAPLSFTYGRLVTPPLS